MDRNKLRDEEWMAMLDTEPDRAMEYLVEAYTALICKEASTYLTNPEDVKDCVSDTFLSVYKHRGSYDPAKGSLAVWIGAIARNRAISLTRKADRDKVCADGDNLAKYLADEADLVGQAEDALDIERAMEALSESDRQMIRMKYFQDMSIAEIAQSLQIPYETAKKRHIRSLKKLKKVLLLLVVLAAIAALAACGIIKTLRYFGIIPGYGVVTEGNEVCALLAEESLKDTDAYHAAVTDATLYNGEVEVDYEFWVLGQDVESAYDNATPTVEWQVALLLPDGTEMEKPLVTEGGSSFNDVFYGSGTAKAVLGDELLKELEESGEYTLTLVIRDVTIDGELYADSVTLPVYLTTISLESLDDYPGEYSEETGGMVLDAQLEGSTLSLNVYTLQGSDWEYSMGLNQSFNGDSSEDVDETPVTIVDEDGNIYEGELPTVEAADQTAGESEEEIEPYSYIPLDYYLGEKDGYSTFLFEGISPGKYTLKLPYIYLLAFGDYGTLEWNLEDCTFFEDAVDIPAGKIYTTSIRRIDSWGEETTDSIMDYFWEIRLRCDLERKDMTVTELGFNGIAAEIQLKPFYKLKHLLGKNDWTSGLHKMSTGSLDEETGELVYKFACDEAYYQCHDLAHISCSPALESQYPISYRYDHEIEIEFEVTE